MHLSFHMEIVFPVVVVMAIAARVATRVVMENIAVVMDAIQIAIVGMDVAHPVWDKTPHAMQD